MTCVVIRKCNRQEIYLWLSEVKIPYWKSDVMNPLETVITFYNAEDRLAFILKFDEYV